MTKIYYLELLCALRHVKLLVPAAFAVAFCRLVGLLWKRERCYSLLFLQYHTRLGHHSYPYPTKWGRYNIFSSCCDKDLAIVFTTGRLPDVNPP
jgi:hypothetical protein